MNKKYIDNLIIYLNKHQFLKEYLWFFGLWVTGFVALGFVASIIRFIFSLAY